MHYPSPVMRLSFCCCYCRKKHTHTHTHTFSNARLGPVLTSTQMGDAFMTLAVLNCGALEAHAAATHQSVSAKSRKADGNSAWGPVYVAPLHSQLVELASCFHNTDSLFSPTLISQPMSHGMLASYLVFSYA